MDTAVHLVPEHHAQGGTNRPERHHADGSADHFPREFHALPIFMRGSALRFLLTRTYDWLNPDPNALVRPKDPREYSRKLRFHAAVGHAGEYGF